MKLYYSPGACSLAPHVVLRESGLPFTLTRVDTQTHKTDDGADFFAVNSKGAVPVLELDNGERLTEGPIIAQYVADTAKNAELMPPPGTLARYRVMEWQNYVTSELHKSFSPMFNSPAVDGGAKAKFGDALKKKLRWVSSKLRDRDYLTGQQFTAADAYLFAVANWAKFVELDVTDCTELQDFMARVSARPAVRQAMKAEGLIS